MEHLNNGVDSLVEYAMSNIHHHLYPADGQYYRQSSTVDANSLE
jgi:hypothetical protein